MVFTAFYVSTRIIINNHKYKAQKCFKLLCPGFFFRPRKFKMALKKSSLLIESFVKKIGEPEGQRDLLQIVNLCLNSQEQDGKKSVLCGKNTAAGGKGRKICSLRLMVSFCMSEQTENFSGVPRTYI